jgi:hypothetical protein
MMYVRVGGFSYSIISLIAMTIRLAHAQLATLLLLLATVVPATATATGPGWSSEADALLAWKASLLDSAALSSWTQGVSACAWDGVICGHDNRVHKVAIQGSRISGGLGALDMAELPKLTELNLMDNKLGGAIPASISQLRSLKLLDLSNNRFDGHIPPQLGDLHNLRDLWLYGNNLVGNIPHQLCGLLSAKRLYLPNNQLTGELPDCWWNLRALELMDLSNNSLSGEIPAAPPTHKCLLWALHLARNNFTGAFPPVLEGCTSLVTLDIRNNMFSGDIPPWIRTRFPLLQTLIGTRSLAGLGHPPHVATRALIQLFFFFDLVRPFPSPAVLVSSRSVLSCH